MSYRISVEDGKYYPEYRSWGFWHYFSYFTRDTAVLEDSGVRVAVFDTEQEARDYIDSHQTRTIIY